MSAPTTDTPIEELSFEEALERLEQHVERLDEDDLSLQEALQAYKEGTSLVARCEEHLDEVSIKLEELSDAIDE